MVHRPWPASFSGAPRADLRCKRQTLLGFKAWGLGFGVWGLGFRVWGLGFRVSLGFGVCVCVGGLMVDRV